MKKRWEFLSCDVRALFLFRVGLAILLILDLLNRGRDLYAHYSDAGILSRSVVIDTYTPWFVSVHNISGAAFVQGILFFIALVFAVFLLLGYKTRTATIVSWFLLISLHSRNPLVLQGGDVLFRMLLFWAMFLPLGAYRSLDLKFKNREKNKHGRINIEKYKSVFSIGTIGILFQVLTLYLFTAFFKSGKEWFPDGTAVYLALSIDQFTTYFGYFLLNFPELLKVLSYTVYFYWFIGAFLLLIPIFFGPIRTFAIFGFIILQAGMGLSMHLGLFPGIAIVAMFPLLPGWFFERLSEKRNNKKIKSLMTSRLSRNFHNIESSVRNIKTEFFSNKLQAVATLIGIFFMIYILLWNIQTLERGYDLPDKFEFVGYVARVDQKWNMFSPYPLRDDGWYVIPGKLKNGEEVDLFKSLKDKEMVVWEKPEHVSSTYKNQRWRKYMMNLWLSENKDYRLYYGKYLCREWNKRHFGEEQLETFDLIFMKEYTMDDYQIPEIEKVSIWEHYCFKAE